MKTTKKAKKAPKVTTNTDTSIVPLVQEAERYIREAVKHFQLTLNPAEIVVTIQAAGRRRMRGWYWGKRWSCATVTINEINLCAEHLKGDMAELLLHELAHAENNHLKIKDCTASQCHNKKFKVMAERLGLIVAPRDKRFGFAFTDMGPEAKAFTEGVKFNQSLFTMTRLGEAGKEKKPGSRLRLYICPGCEQKIRAGTDTLDCTCNECDEKFELQTPAESEG